MSFQNLQLIEPILKALANEGYSNPTPIQQQAIPQVLQKRDLLACAQTGTGKTAAFSIPLLQLMETHRQSVAGNYRELQTLILVPTRELATQVEESIKVYGRFLTFKTAVIFGGVSQSQQVNSIRSGVDIIIATPGRLIDLINQRHISLDRIKYFVLDEADRMLDMGFVQDVNRIIRKLPLKKQTLLFSATMAEEIKHLASQLLHNPAKVEVTPSASTVDKIEQLLYYVERQNKTPLLAHLLNDQSIRTALVFTRTKHGADKLSRNLARAGIKTEAIHGNKSQNERQRVLHNFKSGRTRILVATDIAARGIDIDELGHVFNYDLPQTPETYVHRIGRTGRAGSSGVAFSFCDYEEKILLADIQRLIKKNIAIGKDNPFDAVLMHPQEVKAGFQSSSTRTSFRKKAGKTFRQRA